jgi:valine--pyruvate aminotransferase
VLNLAVGSVGPVLAQPFVETGEILEICRDYIAPYYRAKALQTCEWLKRELAGIPFRIHKPEGAFFLWLWLPELPVTSAVLYKRLKAAGVFVLSGHYFFPGLDSEPWPHRNECLRISFARDETTVKRGVRLLAAEIKKLYR